jgi:hypothetical protein
VSQSQELQKAVSLTMLDVAISTQLLQSHIFNTSLVVSYHNIPSIGLLGAVGHTYLLSSTASSTALSTYDSVAIQVTAQEEPFTDNTQVLDIVSLVLSTFIPVQEEYTFQVRFH